VQRALAAGQISPAELLEHCLARMPDAQRSGAFVTIDENGARRAAAALGRRQRGPLYGIPCAVKDLVDVAGLPTAAGRASGPVAREDAPIVAMLRAAGAVIVGKTRTDELGLATFTPGTHGPHDPGRTVAAPAADRPSRWHSARPSWPSRPTPRAAHAYRQRPAASPACARQPEACRAAVPCRSQRASTGSGSSPPTAQTSISPGGS
jgi:hypothetical protein